jgi:predicted O-methyltransferase YrrM
MDDRIQAVLDAYHERMRREQQERREGRAPETWQARHMLSVGPDTGQLINVLARSLEAPNILELGTSYGYSGIWLGAAARETGGRLTTMELHDDKAAHARAMAEKAGLADHIDFRVGDAVEMIGDLDFGIDFVLLDLWKDMYLPCLEAFYPKLNPGAIIVADNILYPGGDNVRRYVEAVRARPGMRSLLLPVGTGLEVSRYKAD